MLVVELKNDENAMAIEESNWEPEEVDSEHVPVKSQQWKIILLKSLMLIHLVSSSQQVVLTSSQSSQVQMVFFSLLLQGLGHLQIRVSLVYILTTAKELTLHFSDLYKRISTQI